MAGDKTPPESNSPDPNSPLYIHASDYPKQMHVNDVLTDSNFADWSQEMMNFLFAKNKVGFVDGSIKKPEETSADYSLWMRCDAMIKGWLTTAMDKDIRASVKYAATAADMWADLTERFGKESAPRAYELKRLLSATNQNDSSVSAYFTKLRGLWDEIETVLPSPQCTCNGCTCDIGKKLYLHRQKEKTYGFLMGLENEYSVIRTQVLAMNPFPTLGAAYRLVSEDEQHRSISADKKPSRETAAFKTTMHGRREGSQRHDKSLPKETKSSDVVSHCTFCGRDGHSRDGCFKIIGYPEWWQGNRKRQETKSKAACTEMAPSPISGLTATQYETFLKHFAAVEGTSKEDRTPSAYMAGKYNNDDDWVMDSGSTEHITHDIDILENQTKNRIETPVLIPNGDAIRVEGRGECTLPWGTKVKGVLYIPKFTCNLLSVSRLSNDLQSAITFFPDFCVMQKLYTRNLIGAGECKRGLYRMGMIGKERQAMMTTSDMWHKRLGHASGEKFTQIDFLNWPKDFLDPPNFATNYEEIHVHKSISQEINTEVHCQENGDMGSILENPIEPTNHGLPMGSPSEEQPHATEATEGSHFESPHEPIQEEQPIAEPETTRPKRNRSQPKRFQDFQSHKVVLAAIDSTDEPKYFHQAIKDDRWKEAMKKEICALENNGTWTLESIPEGKRAIDSKWVYKIKNKPNGEVEQYKARLVAKGFTQLEGIDYHDTLAPVAKLVTVRTLLAVAVKKDWDIHQLDDNNAFLHGDLDEEVYMKIPQGFAQEGETRVCRLRKSLYGLKQASRNWYQKFTNSLLKLGFNQSKADHSLFLQQRGQSFVAALIYVDDVIIVGNDTKNIQSTKDELNKRFSIKDLGRLKYFLGIEVARTTEGLVLTQRKYTLDILDDCGLQGCRPSLFPIEQNLKLDKLKVKQRSMLTNTAE
ncbi:uncharacterized protein LOC143634207 [Bidens hawaiensis]|uniref:uncharacterized protein LOC143634207 n=1 Tax=Bidens hawaiensis TaxID=980011 RepID=UPI00404B5315